MHKTIKKNTATISFAKEIGQGIAGIDIELAYSALSLTE